jgi:hypothetical protein
MLLYHFWFVSYPNTLIVLLLRLSTCYSRRLPKTQIISNTCLPFFPFLRQFVNFPVAPTVNHRTELSFFRESVYFLPTVIQNRYSSLVRSVNITAMLNVSEYYPYQKKQRKPARCRQENVHIVCIHQPCYLPNSIWDELMLSELLTFPRIRMVRACSTLG